jgi:hypothetical protein
MIVRAFTDWVGELFAERAQADAVRAADLVKRVG